MAKKPARRAPSQGSIFDHFASHGREDYRDEPQDQETPDASASILARLERMEAENARLREELYRPAAAPAAAAAGGAGNIAPKFDLTGLPDAVADPQGHQRELEARVSGFVAHTAHQVRQEVTSEHQQSSQADALWGSFSAQHPEWTEHQDLVGIVAQQLVQKAQARGWDTQKYVLGDSEKFLSDINRELNAKYGALVRGRDEETEGEELEDRSSNAFLGGPGEDLDDSERTAGLFGGQESGGKPAKGKAASPDADMIKDLHDLQRRSGFFSFTSLIFAGMVSLLMLTGEPAHAKADRTSGGTWSSLQK